MLGSSLPPVGRSDHVLFSFFFFALRIVSNSYCFVFLLCFTSSCQFLWIVHCLSVFSNFYLYS